MILFNPTLLESDQPNQQKMNYLMSFAGDSLSGLQLVGYRLFFRWFNQGGTGSIALQGKVEVATLSYPTWWIFQQGLFRQVLVRTNYSPKKTDYFLPSVQEDLVSKAYGLE